MATRIERMIDDADRHRSYKEIQQPSVSTNLDKGDLEDLEKWVVKLEFHFGGKPFHPIGCGTMNGTGFFVNLPSVEHDVILTAGHNLIDEHGTKAKYLAVVGDDSPVKDFKICPQYEQKPDEKSARYDYGVVLLPKKGGQGKGPGKIKNADARQGLGLNLSFSSDKYLENVSQIWVSGYRDTSIKPVTSSGGIVGVGPLLSYKALTEQGMSGSPVWAGYDGFAVAMAIHNTRPAKKGGGSRGTKITEEVFRNICTWSNVGYFGKRLRVDAKNAPKSHNLYFSFPENSEFAKVFLGSSAAASSNETATTFDILPAYVSQTSSNRQPLWAFMFHRPSSWGEEDEKSPQKRWVQWQSDRQRAVLVDRLLDVNLVRLVDVTRTKFRIMQVSRGKNGELLEMELRLHDNDQTEEDIDDGMDVVAGVSFGPYKQLGVKEYRTFSFE